MNERIRELARQSGCDFLYDYNVNGHAIVCDVKDIEKFAELIVRECVDKIGENFVGAVGTHASAHNSAVMKCQKIIKQHFGVEE